MSYLDEDETEINPDFIPKAGLCLVCKKNNDRLQKRLCDMVRIGQDGKDDFDCSSFESIDE